MENSDIQPMLVCGCGEQCSCHKKVNEIQHEQIDTQQDKISLKNEPTDNIVDVNELDNKSVTKKKYIKSKRCAKCRAMGLSRANNLALNGDTDILLTPDGYKSRRKTLWEKLSIPLYEFRLNGRHLFKKPDEEDYADLPVMLKVVDTVATGVARVTSQIMQPVTAVGDVVNISKCYRYIANPPPNNYNQTITNGTIVSTSMDLNPGHIRSRNKALEKKKEISNSLTNIKDEINDEINDIPNDYIQSTVD